MQALLLAGGMGTRLRPLTDDLPKPMAPLGGRPWLESLVTHLRSSGVRDIVMTIKHFPEVIEKHFGDGSRYGVRIVYAREEKLLGTAGAIKNAEKYLEDRFLVINADVVHLWDVEALYAAHTRHGGWATIALTEVEDPSAYGVVALNANDEIIRFVEKPRREEAPSHLINAGAYVLEKKVLSLIPKDTEVSIERETFPHLIALHKGVFGHTITGYWMDMGTPERYKQTHWDLLDGAFNLPLLPPEREPGIYVGRRVRIAKETTLHPPVVIGDGTIIEEGSVIGPYAIIGSGVVIGKGSTVSRAILWKGARVAHFCQIKDAVLGSDTDMTAGLILNGGIVRRISETVSQSAAGLLNKEAIGLGARATDSGTFKKAVVQP
ncbi:MAG: Mannose-1-phosphate guanylyltransferase [Candidatus Carbobacillus altaicus]|uniref:Mannose-1-phosphate guanylyltransferase n=1 Tax=Candidatus Carbonibacillus altaicus TaxID=2163959 RepID=A0A2R6Y590_9BACL|nr:MAG: Mannose-1-phosphate guanylyltransferase [Candidatus Carbobacillus altaicus]